MYPSHCFLQYILVILILISGIQEGYAQYTETYINGTVVDGDGEALPYVNVILKGTIEGAATGRDGTFGFSTTQTGTQTIVASMIGYEPVVKRLELTPGDSVELHIVLPSNPDQYGGGCCDGQ